MYGFNELSLTAMSMQIVETRAQERAARVEQRAKKFAASKKGREFARKVAEMNAQAERRREEHRQKRLAEGLSAEAGTGTPEPPVVLRQTTNDSIGTSRVGGFPDLPAQFEWPVDRGKKLPFLAQINLTELAGLRTSPLPPDGMLYAFGAWDEVLQVVVKIHRGAPTQLVRSPRPQCEVYEAVPVRLVPHNSSESLGDRYGPGKPAGWIFGEVYGGFGTAGEFADYAMLDGDDWINLLAIESVGSMCWSDAGHLYVLIRRSDLERGDFCNVLGAVGSS